MGTITVNVRDETEENFRAAVKENLGEGKGKLGRALDEAMSKWLKDKENEALRQRAIERLKRGMYKLPKDYKFRREDAYEER